MLEAIYEDFISCGGPSNCYFPVKLRGDTNRCSHKSTPLGKSVEYNCRCFVCEKCHHVITEETMDDGAIRVCLVPPCEDTARAIRRDGKTPTVKNSLPLKIIKSRYDIAKGID